MAFRPAPDPVEAVEALPSTPAAAQDVTDPWWVLCLLHAADKELCNVKQMTILTCVISLITEAVYNIFLPR